MKRALALGFVFMFYHWILGQELPPVFKDGNVITFRNYPKMKTETHLSKGNFCNFYYVLASRGTWVELAESIPVEYDVKKQIVSEFFEKKIITETKVKMKDPVNIGWYNAEEFRNVILVKESVQASQSPLQPMLFKPAQESDTKPEPEARPSPNPEWDKINEQFGRTNK